MGEVSGSGRALPGFLGELAITALLRIACLIALLGPLLATAQYLPYLQAVPTLIQKGGLEASSKPLLALASAASIAACLARPGPSLYTLSLFFAALADPLAVAGDPWGPVKILAGLSIVLLVDTYRSTARHGQGESLQLAWPGGRKPLVHVIVFLATILGPPLALSPYIAGFVLSLKFSTENPYMSPLASFLSYNPVGVMIVALILLSVVYMLARSLTEAVVSYAVPSPRVALIELSGSANLEGIRYPLASLRGLVLSATISPALYSLVSEALTRSGILQPDTGDLVQRLARGAISLAIFMIMWIVFSRSMFHDSREPDLWGFLSTAALVPILYLTAYFAGVWDPGRGLADLSGLDVFIASSVASYYQQIWILIDLILRAAGAAP